MHDDGYTTPEGFWLPQPLLLPDARSFSDVLEYAGEWGEELISARFIPEETPDADEWEREAWRGDGRNQIGPYCTVDARAIGGKSHRSLMVRATDAVIEAVAPRIVTPDDSLSFRLVAHAVVPPEWEDYAKQYGREEARERAMQLGSHYATERVLVILEHGYIIGSHWLAYIDPTTIPPYPYAARDARYGELYAAIEEQGARPFRRDLPGGAIELTANPGPSIAATIHSDGSVTRKWADGTITEEPVRS